MVGLRLTNVEFPPVRKLDETRILAVMATAEVASVDPIADACDIVNRSAARAGYPFAFARVFRHLGTYAGQINVTIRNPLLLPLPRCEWTICVTPPAAAAAPASIAARPANMSEIELSLNIVGSFRVPLEVCEHARAQRRPYRQPLVA